MSLNVLYIVVGDIGHSPRILLHVEESLKLKNANKVGCLALLESSIPKRIQSDEKFSFYNLKSCSIEKNSAFYPLFAMFKFLFLSFYILWFLLWESSITWDVVICQNAPAVPLFLLLLFSKIFSRRPFLWVIDWHNLGYTLLPPRRWILRSIYKYIELRVGNFANYHLTVTQGLKDYLVEEGFERYHPPNDVIYHSLRSAIFVARDYPRAVQDLMSRAELETRVSSIENGLWKSTDLSMKEIFSKNPKLLLSSTSWTPDENFDMLLESIDHLEKNDMLPHSLLIVITGKGLLKDTFIHKLEDKKTTWKRTTFVLGWFSLSDYYSLLSCADLGISLHVSSSGLDFPMKVVDMVSCNTPKVAALEFKCLREGFSSLDTGTELLPFSNEITLAKIICSVFASTPRAQLSKLPSQHATFTSYWRSYMNAAVPNLIALGN